MHMTIFVGSNVPSLDGPCEREHDSPTVSVQERESAYGQGGLLTIHFDHLHDMELFGQAMLAAATQWQHSVEDFDRQQAREGDSGMSTGNASVEGLTPVDEHGKTPNEGTPENPIVYSRCERCGNLQIQCSCPKPAELP